MSDFTKKAIKESFKELLSEKTVDKITVVDICKHCGIHKNTFYYHYEDLPQLLEELVISYADEFIAQYHDINSMNDCVLALQKFIQDNIKIIRHLVDAHSYSYVIQNLIWKICEHISDEYVDIFFPGEILEDRTKALLKHSTKCELFGYIEDWIYNGMKDRIYDLNELYQIRKEALEKLMNK